MRTRRGSWSPSDFLQPEGKRVQIYGKIKNEWIALGPPRSIEDARKEIAAMKQEGRVQEPHFVPL